MKKFLFLAIILPVVISICSICASAEVTSQKYGDNITVYVSEDRTTLHLSGSGRMYDRPENTHYIDCGTITTVKIDHGITHLGNYAFYGLRYVEEIIIPSTVTEIGSNAFSSCYELKNVVIPDGVTKIGENAFNSCNKLEKIILPQTLESIGAGCFANSGIIEISIPDKITDIPERAFDSCKNLKKITLPEGIERIGEDAFLKCTTLESISLPDTVKIIESGAFYECEALCDIRINEGLEVLGSHVFMFCYNMKYLYLPSSITELGDHILSYSGVTKVEYNGTKDQWTKIRPKFWPGDRSSYDGSGIFSTPTCLQGSSCGANLESGYVAIALTAVAICFIVKKKKAHCDK